MLAARLQPCLCRCVGRNRELLYAQALHEELVYRIAILCSGCRAWGTRSRGGLTQVPRHCRLFKLANALGCACGLLPQVRSSLELLLHLTFGGLLQEAGPLRSCTPLPLHGVEIQVLQAALAATVRMACPLRPVPLPSRPASLVARTPLNQRPLHS